MNVIEEIKRINEVELQQGLVNTSASWHCKYANSAWIYLGNLPHELTEGDVLCVLSQFGEVRLIWTVSVFSTLLLVENALLLEWHHALYASTSNMASINLASCRIFQKRTISLNMKIYWIREASRDIVRASVAFNSSNFSSYCCLCISFAPCAGRRCEFGKGWGNRKVEGIWFSKVWRCSKLYSLSR